ncbi:MAG: nitrate reductase molybdenum cofactor assembly chaperone [Gammaproteobacteria bacterium]|nr:MAG: nitrate reductase molybdenum cofactor assembly chaperone [Gammaproteobacteria bacterium]
MSSYVLMAKLLDYPSDELLENLPIIEQSLQEASDLSAGQKQTLLKVAAEIKATPLMELQGTYVDTFDMNGKHSLHITHHLYGEEAERGLAMADLITHYQKYDLDISNGELPDFLPLILEFLSILEPAEADGFLSQAANAIDLLYKNLKESECFYAPIIGVLLAKTDRIPVQQAK